MTDVSPSEATEREDKVEYLAKTLRIPQEEAHILLENMRADR